MSRYRNRLKTKRDTLNDKYHAYLELPHGVTVFPGSFADPTHFEMGSPSGDTYLVPVNRYTEFEALSKKHSPGKERDEVIEQWLIDNAILMFDFFADDLYDILDNDHKTNMRYQAWLISLIKRKKEAHAV